VTTGRDGQDMEWNVRGAFQREMDHIIAATRATVVGARVVHGTGVSRNSIGTKTVGLCPVSGTVGAGLCPFSSAAAGAEKITPILVCKPNVEASISSLRVVGAGGGLGSVWQRLYVALGMSLREL